MSATEVAVGHLRPDLAAVKPMFYPLVEQERFGSIEALCLRLGIPVELIQLHVNRALVEMSDHVVIEQLRLGDPANELVAVLVFNAPEVMLCAGLFGEISDSQEDAQAWLDEFAASPEFKNRFMAVAEFRPNPKLPPQ